MSMYTSQVPSDAEGSVTSSRREKPRRTVKYHPSKPLTEASEPDEVIPEDTPVVTVKIQDHDRVLSKGSESRGVASSYVSAKPVNPPFATASVADTSVLDDKASEVKELPRRADSIQPEASQKSTIYKPTLTLTKNSKERAESRQEYIAPQDSASQVGARGVPSPPLKGPKSPTGNSTYSYDFE
jgi:hypothetical protein